MIDNTNDKQILYSIYYAFENNKNLNQKDILKNCIISTLSVDNYLNNETLIVKCIDLINILNNNLRIFVQDGHFRLNKNKYFINEEHEDFHTFKINNLKFLKITSHSIEYITKLNEMIDDIAMGFSISSLENNEEIDSETNEEITKYYVCHSLTNYIDLYLISIDFATCTCKSFQYCITDIKTCKHIKKLKAPNVNLNLIYHIVTKIGNNFNECTCDNFKSCGLCNHLKYLCDNF